MLAAFACIVSTLGGGLYVVTPGPAPAAAAAPPAPVAASGSAQPDELSGRWALYDGQGQRRIAEAKPVIMTLKPRIKVYLNDGDKVRRARAQRPHADEDLD
jgi:hypothetical protein